MSGTPLNAAHEELNGLFDRSPSSKATKQRKQP